MRSFEELRLMGDAERQLVENIAKQGNTIGGILFPFDGGDKYPCLSNDVIAEGERILGANPEKFYKESTFFQVFDPRLVASACNIPDCLEEDGISYNMHWFDVFGKEGLKYLASLPAFIALKESH